MYATGKIDRTYQAQANKRSRQRQQAAAAWVKTNRGDVWQEICRKIEGDQRVE